jgi:hypothetical protein
MLGALAVAGCGGGGDRSEAPQDTAGMMDHMDSGGVGMGNMRGMSMENMRAHMDSMTRMSPQQIQGMMAMHEQMMSRMMDGMGADMREMNMGGMPEWSALTDSVKRDLADLPNLKGQELSNRTRSHAERVKRLIALHEQVMKH